MTYALLDSGRGRKLEQVGPYLLDRQCPVAFWRPRLPAAEWSRCDGFHQRSDKGGGFWKWQKKLPESWNIEWGGLKLKLKPTAFGHLGFFAEQAEQWNWLRAQTGPGAALNLFAYTGGSTLSLAQGGWEVTHVDAAKGIVDWARENASLNAIPAERLRFAVEDCLVFLDREKKRGRRYQGLVMDPPSYGRGPKKEIFKLEDDIEGLLEKAGAVLSEEPRFFHFSCHSPGFTPTVLKNLLSDQPWARRFTRIESGEMQVLEKSGRPVPSGVFCRLSADSPSR